MEVIASFWSRGNHATEWQDALTSLKQQQKGKRVQAPESKLKINQTTAIRYQQRMAVELVFSQLRDHRSPIATRCPMPSRTPGSSGVTKGRWSDCAFRIILMTKQFISIVALSWGNERTLLSADQHPRNCIWL